MRIRFSCFVCLLLIFAVTARVAVAAEPLPLVLDMVPYHPGEPKYPTGFADPAVTKSMGFNGKVFFLFDAATLAVNWDDVNTNIFPVGSAGRAWVDAKATNLHSLYGAAAADGVPQPAKACGLGLQQPSHRSAG